MDNLPTGGAPAVTNITNIIYNFNLTPSQAKPSSGAAPVQSSSTKQEEGKRSPNNKQRPHTSKQSSSLAVGEAGSDGAEGINNEQDGSSPSKGGMKIMSTIEDAKKRGQEDLVYDKQIMLSAAATIGAQSNSSAKHSNRKRPHTGSLNPRGGPAEPTPVQKGGSKPEMNTGIIQEKRNKSGANQKLSANKFQAPSIYGGFQT